MTARYDATVSVLAQMLATVHDRVAALSVSLEDERAVDHDDIERELAATWDDLVRMLPEDLGTEVEALAERWREPLPLSERLLDARDTLAELRRRAPS